MPRNNKSHCWNGHEYTKLNTYIDHRGYRHCKECRKLWQRIERARYKIK